MHALHFTECSWPALTVFGTVLLEMRIIVGSSGQAGDIEELKKVQKMQEIGELCEVQDMQDIFEQCRRFIRDRRYRSNEGGQKLAGYIGALNGVQERQEIKKHCRRFRIGSQENKEHCRRFMRGRRYRGTAGGSGETGDMEVLQEVQEGQQIQEICRRFRRGRIYRSTAGSVVRLGTYPAFTVNLMVPGQK